MCAGQRQAGQGQFARVRTALQLQPCYGLLLTSQLCDLLLLLLLLLLCLSRSFPVRCQALVVVWWCVLLLPSITPW